MAELLACFATHLQILLVLINLARALILTLFGSHASRQEHGMFLFMPEHMCFLGVGVTKSKNKQDVVVLKDDIFCCVRRNTCV